MKEKPSAKVIEQPLSEKNSDEESEIEDYVNFNDIKELREEITQEIIEIFEEMFVEKTEVIRDDIRENVTDLLPDLLVNHD